jgi:hypothetical protein
MIAPIRHYKVPIGGDHYAVWPVEARDRALPVNETRLPVAGQCADNGTRPCHRAKGVVAVIRHYHIAGPVHSQAIWALEASENASTVLELPTFTSIPSKGDHPCQLPEGGSWQIVCE